MVNYYCNMKQKSLISVVFTLLIFGVFVVGGVNSLSGKKISHTNSHEAMASSPLHESPCSFMNGQVCLMSFVEHLRYLQNLLTASMPEFLSLLLLFFGGFYVWKKGKDFITAVYNNLHQTSLRQTPFFVFDRFRHFLWMPEYQTVQSLVRDFVKLHPRLYA